MINMKIDNEIIYLMTGLFGFLFLASVFGQILKRRSQSEKNSAVITNLNARIKAWWMMCFVFLVAMLSGGVGSFILFGILSFLALREYITLTPTKNSDHRTLFWAFFIILPFQYFYLGIKWYGMFSIFIPVYVFIFLPIRNVLSGDIDRFLERTAKIQWGLMICVYCVSHAPALLILDIPGFEGENAKLLFFLVCVAQMSDVLQYIFGKLFGKRPIAPNVSPNKTVEGLAYGMSGATILGALLWWITPFTFLQAAGFSLVITAAGFFGGLTMSAIKRDRGVKDFGAMIQGHGGVLDRIDSLCFSAPLFFHLVRYYFT